MTAIVLTYHSHHVLGSTYGLNDHVALPIDLEVLTREGVRIVSLDELVALATSGRPIRELIAALTFDDGPLYDFADFVHPRYGPQPSFRTTMRSFRLTTLGAWQSSLNATSFVIASPEARLVMERTADVQYTWLADGSMSDSWWEDAVDEGAIRIANHSWDHLHPGLETVAHSRQVKADFSAVDNCEDADAQIAGAANFIQMRTNNKMSPYFAYPFGQHNAFLVESYFPLGTSRHGASAAFTTAPGVIRGGESVWCLPRYVCGHHWKAPTDLTNIIRNDMRT
jgi:peptidoglycan/xylan/chitin deacetylase (PgdA/CDA1 family)